MPCRQATFCKPFASCRTGRPPAHQQQQQAVCRQAAYAVVANPCMDGPQGSTSARGLDLADWTQGHGASFGNLDDLPALRADSPPPASTDSPGTRGRKRDAEAAGVCLSCTRLAAQLESPPQQQINYSQSGQPGVLAQLGRDDGAQLDGKRTATGKPSANAARNKACRERQRRERLNDWSAPPLVSCAASQSRHCC